MMSESYDSKRYNVVKSSKQLLLVWLAQFAVQNVHVQSVLHGFLTTLAKKAGLLVTYSLPN